MSPPPGVHLRFGEYEIDSDTRLLLKSGTPTALTPKAFQLLELLIRSRPAIVSKREILGALWPETYVSEANVSNLVSEIRATLEDTARRPQYVRTSHGAGYAFCGTAVECAARSRRDVGGAANCSLVGNAGTFSLVEGTQVLGRGDDCDLVLASPVVSRHHARIHVSGENVVIEDLRSRNGTFVRGKRIGAPVSLYRDDVVSIGNVTLRFRVIDPSRTTDTLSLPGHVDLQES
jgi:DNA-binding winged helix-turn-helix (wHTH) protein